MTERSTTPPANIILWALPQYETDRIHERPMTSMPLTSEQADRVERAAAADGWHSFRRATETGEAPDFTGGLR